VSERRSVPTRGLLEILNCGEGYAVVSECPLPLVYNIINMWHDYPAIVNCGERNHRPVEGATTTYRAAESSVTSKPHDVTDNITAIELLSLLLFEQCIYSDKSRQS
jgi:hypothetical protein